MQETASGKWLAVTVPQPYQKPDSAPRIDIFYVPGDTNIQKVLRETRSYTRHFSKHRRIMTTPLDESQTRRLLEIINESPNMTIEEVQQHGLVTYGDILGLDNSEVLQ